MTHPAPQKPAHIREFTPRSIVVGLLVALVIGASYPYVVLKFGFGPNISVVSAFFGFLALGLFSKNYNRWENNIVQTAGTTAGQIAFLCWLLAASTCSPPSRAAASTCTSRGCRPGLALGVGAARRAARRAAAQALHRGREPAVPRRHRRRRDADHARLARPAGAASRRSRWSARWSLGAALPRHAAPLDRRRDPASRVNAFSARVGLGFGVSLLNIGSGHHHRPAHQRQHADRRHHRLGASRRRGCSSTG